MVHSNHIHIESWYKLILISRIISIYHTYKSIFFVTCYSIAGACAKKLLTLPNIYYDVIIANNVIFWACMPAETFEDRDRHYELYLHLQHYSLCTVLTHYLAWWS